MNPSTDSGPNRPPIPAQAVRASLAKGRLRDKREELELGAERAGEPHLPFLLAVQLGHIDNLDEAMEKLGWQIEERMRPFAEGLRNLLTIPRSLIAVVGAREESPISEI